MKNLIQVSTISTCSKCEKTGFFCNYDVDGISCPFCNIMVYETSIADYFAEDSEHDEDDKDDERYEYLKMYYCEDCRIIYKHGCIHYLSEHGNSNYNGHLISKYEYKNQTYNGMPQFKNERELNKEFKNIKILEWTCLNSSLCKGDAYCLNNVKPPNYKCKLLNTTDIKC